MLNGIIIVLIVIYITSVFICFLIMFLAKSTVVMTRAKFRKGIITSIIPFYNTYILIKDLK